MHNDNQLLSIDKEATIERLQQLRSQKLVILRIKELNKAITPEMRPSSMADYTAIAKQADALLAKIDKELDMKRKYLVNPSKNATIAQKREVVAKHRHKLSLVRTLCATFIIQSRRAGFDI